MNEAKKYRFLLIAEIAFALGIMYFFTANNLKPELVPPKKAGNLIVVFYIVRVLVLMHAIYCSLKLMHISLVKNATATKNPKRKLTFYALLVFFLMGEIVFMFIPQSQGNTMFGLGTRVWNTFYANRNEKKYRDENLEGRINTTKKKIFFLGDSFTHGQGIKNPKDRFSNIIAEKINRNEYEIFNLGMGNSDTRDEFIRLTQFDARPDVLILQYYFNDIEPTMHEFEIKNDKPKGLGEIAFLATGYTLQTSFFLNFIAVNLVKFTPAFKSANFKKQVAAAYHDKNVLNEHLHDLQSIINYCTLNKTKLYVLFIPDMREPAFSEKDCYPVIVNFLDEKKIPCISIYNEIKNKTTTELVVSSTDAHANESVQKIIAEKLMKNIPEFNP